MVDINTFVGDCTIPVYPRAVNPGLAGVVWVGFAPARYSTASSIRVYSRRSVQSVRRIPSTLFPLTFRAATDVGSHPRIGSHVFLNCNAQFRLVYLYVVIINPWYPHKEWTVLDVSKL